MMINAYVEQIKQEAANYVKQEQIPYLPLNGYQEYLEKGERLAFETAYFARRKQLTVVALSYFLEKKNETKNFLEQLIWEICNEYSWSLPAHLPIENQMFTNESVSWIDLFAAETGQALAEIYERVGEDFSPIIQARMQHEMENRIFQPFLRKTWEWEDKENNWSAVIGGCIGLSALAILPKNSELQLKLIEKVDRSLQSYLRSFGEDGACEEGIGYWAYGFGYYLYFAQKLSEVLNNPTYLEIPKVKNIAAFPYYVTLTEKTALPFSDYHPAVLPSGLLSFCAEYFHVRVPQIKAANDLDFDHCYRFAHLYRNLIWTKPYSQTTKEISHYFSDVEWGVLQSETQQFAFAAKGGRNDESHNHIDVGHFVFGSLEELLLSDLGAGEYTKDYFDEKKRYTFLVNNALGHSIPIINGYYQQAGKVKAKDTIFLDNQQGSKIFTTRLEDTYTQEAKIVYFERNLTVDSIQKVMLLDDEFIFTENSNQVIENFVTTFPVEVNEKIVRIKGKKSCVMNFVDVEEIRVRKEYYKNHDGIQCQANLIQATYKLSKESSIRIGIRLLD